MPDSPRVALTLILLLAAVPAQAEVCSGCGCRGGPGYRGPSGSCVGWDALSKTCGSPPTTRCTAEQVNPRPGETKEAPAPRRESARPSDGGSKTRQAPNPF